MRMDKKIRNKKLKSKINERIAGKVDVQLGKNGITLGFIEELKSRLEKHHVVKIRVLKSYRETYEEKIEELALKLAEKTGSSIYEIRGYTIILIKEK